MSSESQISSLLNICMSSQESLDKNWKNLLLYINDKSAHSVELIIRLIWEKFKDINNSINFKILLLEIWERLVIIDHHCSNVTIESGFLKKIEELAKRKKQGNLKRRKANYFKSSEDNLSVAKCIEKAGHMLQHWARSKIDGTSKIDQKYVLAFENLQKQGIFLSEQQNLKTFDGDLNYNSNIQNDISFLSIENNKLNSTWNEANASNSSSVINKKSHLTSDKNSYFPERLVGDLEIQEEMENLEMAYFNSYLDFSKSIEDESHIETKLIDASNSAELLKEMLSTPEDFDKKDILEECAQQCRNHLNILQNLSASTIEDSRFSNNQQIAKTIEIIKFSLSEFSNWELSLKTSKLNKASSSSENNKQINNQDKDVNINNLENQKVTHEAYENQIQNSEISSTIIPTTSDKKFITSNANLQPSNNKTLYKQNSDFFENKAKEDFTQQLNTVKLNFKKEIKGLNFELEKKKKETIEYRKILSKTQATVNSQAKEIDSLNSKINDYLVKIKNLELQIETLQNTIDTMKTKLDILDSNSINKSAGITSSLQENNFNLLKNSNMKNNSLELSNRIEKELTEDNHTTILTNKNENPTDLYKASYINSKNCNEIESSIQTFKQPDAKLLQKEAKFEDLSIINLEFNLSSILNFEDLSYKEEKNISRFKKLLSCNEGLLYEDNQVKIGIISKYIESRGKILLCFKNKQSTQLQKFQTTFFILDENALQIKISCIPENLEPNQRILQELLIQCVGPFKDLPILRLEFTTSNKSHTSIDIYLPITVTKFFFISPVDKALFFDFWNDNQFIQTNLLYKIKLKNELKDSISDIRSLASLGGTLFLCNNIDTSTESIILFGSMSVKKKKENSQFYNVLIRIQTQKIDKDFVRVNIRSNDIKLADIICSLITIAIGSY